MSFAPSIRRERMPQSERPIVAKRAKKPSGVKVQPYAEWRASKPQIQVAGWPHIRKRIVARDFATCRICQESPDRLEVHHIDYDRRNNDDENLVTLCPDCHRAIHMERYKPSEHEGWGVPWTPAPVDEPC